MKVRVKLNKLIDKRDDLKAWSIYFLSFTFSKELKCAIVTLFPINIYITW